MGRQLRFANVPLLDALSHHDQTLAPDHQAGQESLLVMIHGAMAPSTGEAGHEVIQEVGRAVVAIREV